jgi:hypothetical protein
MSSTKTLCRDCKCEFYPDCHVNGDSCGTCITSLGCHGKLDDKGVRIDPDTLENDVLCPQCDTYQDPHEFKNGVCEMCAPDE